jgi:hypothetical protein
MSRIKLITKIDILSKNHENCTFPVNSCVDSNLQAVARAKTFGKSEPEQIVSALQHCSTQFKGTVSRGLYFDTKTLLIPPPQRWAKLI